MQGDEENELNLKLNQSADSISEKVAILVLRDKCIRSRRERQTDIRTAKAVLGTCPDMCPEYERYFREDTNQLSMFEMSGDKEGDPFAIVKEYRRSGADQEEPLPHELRPPIVLTRTMDYLVCNVLDRYDQNVGEWYDFVWSRLRAIRKDLTQQHLCDLDAVQLLEKCTRFHIFCRHYLCEEDAAAFDPKINDDNLSQCLQSLRDFYYDLSLEGISCENEPEFRCYEVLLNLKGTGILQEVKSMRKELRDSEAIKFAIDVYIAFTSNNFIKFFKLVNQTTYLNSCIIHRYFNEYRFISLKIFQKSCSKRTQYPVNKLINQLGFNDFDEVSNFFKAVGVTIQDDHIHLSSDTVISSFVGLPLVRSYRLIEGKRQNLSVGEIINGAPLPPNPYGQYPVHNSFDEFNRLKKEAISAEDQSLKIKMLEKYGEIREEPLTNMSTHIATNPFARIEKPLFQSNTIITKLPAKIKEEYSSQMFDAIAAISFNSIVDSICCDVLSGVFLDVKSELFAGQILDTVVNDISLQACKYVLNIEKKELQLKLQLETVSAILSEEFTEQLIDEVLGKLLFLVATDVYGDEVKDYIDTESSVLVNTILKNGVRSLLCTIGEFCLKCAIDEREKLVSEILAKRAARLAKQCINVWREKVRRARRYRYIRDSFPASNVEGRPILIRNIDQLNFKREHSEAFHGDVCDTSTKKTKAKVKKPEPTIAPALFAIHVHSLKNDRLTRVSSRSSDSLEEKLQELNRSIDEERRNSNLFGDSLEALQQSLQFVKSSEVDT